jgi:hypothetical protein
MDDPSAIPPQIPPIDEAPPIAPPVAEEPEPIPLKGIPFPPWLIAFTIVTGLALLLGVSRIKHAFGEGISYERATRQLAAGNATEALPALKRAEEEYPESIDAKINLADAANQADELDVAVDTFNKLEGKEVTAEQKSSLDRIEASITGKVEQLEKESKVKPK